jgi:hypothetical protein
VCASAPAQSYAIYLPSTYSRDRAWPILYAFDAGARGSLPVERYREAAERYGYIVIGSNNSRNGPMTIADEAFRAILADTSARFSIDARRVYATGFSGGARVAVVAGLAMKERTAGVIGSAAGFPPGVQPSAAAFPYYGTVGTDDFNYPEMKQLDAALDTAGVRHWLEVFEGGHDWPPVAVCTRALEWMELEAMRSKRRPRDDSTIDSILSRWSTDASADEQAGRLYAAYQRWSAVAAAFAGLRDVKASEQKARQLADTREVKRAVEEEKESIGRQEAAATRVVRLVQQALEGEDRIPATSQFLIFLGGLKGQSERPRNDAARMAARRVLVSSWIQLREETARDMEVGELGRASARLALMGQMRPDDPAVDYRLARLNARRGRKGDAIEALRNAVKKGLSDAAVVEEEPDFAPLRSEAAFQRLLAQLKRHPAA